MEKQEEENKDITIIPTKEPRFVRFDAGRYSSEGHSWNGKSYVNYSHRPEE